MKSLPKGRLLAPVVLCALGACASAAARPPVLASGAGLVVAGSAATAVALATADSAARAFAPADVEFMQGMIPHHAQAVIMGRWAATHGARADVQRLCLRIVAAQSDEINMMRRWLRERKQDVPDSNATRRPSGDNRGRPVAAKPHWPCGRLRQKRRRPCPDDAVGLWLS